MTSQLRAVIFFVCLVGHTNCETNRRYKNIYGTKKFDPSDQITNLAGVLPGSGNIVLEAEKFAQSEYPDKTPSDGDTYDFVVVGAGTAGPVLAARLSELKQVTVLLIEAGPSERLAMDIPLGVNIWQLDDEVNWKYTTEPSNDYCRGMVNRECKWPRGKVMGGSSVLNYMVATRGHPRDYDRWAELGNEGWSWQDVLPYFKKLETSDNSGTSGKRDNIRGHEGPVYLGRLPFHTPIATAFIKAGVELGYKVSDYNGRDYAGFSYLETNIKDGLRVSSNVAYLHPIKHRRNLMVTKNSLVSKLILSDDSSRVVGVEYIKNGRSRRIYAKKEVILSAGTIGSAQILMLSGIGPAEQLQDLGIDVIVNASVGENLMDHIACGAMAFEVDQPVALNLNTLANPANPYLRDYLLYRTGPFAIPGGSEALAFIDIDSPASATDVYPNVELFFVSASFATMGTARQSLGMSNDFWKKTYSQVKNDTWTVFPMLLRPKSRGRILLKSTNINTKPRIISNYMTDKEDVRILVGGVRSVLKIAKTQAMRRFGSRLNPGRIAGCESFVTDSDEYWECATRAVTMNIYHYSGTCKMGPETDPTAVVDARLKVYGVDGLRVGDASIMPEIPSGHTNIPVFMIAEKLADMIKEDWGYPIAPNI